MGAWEPLRPLKTPSPEFVLVCAGGKGEGPASSSGLRHLTWTLPSRPQVFPGLGRPSHGFFISCQPRPSPATRASTWKGGKGGETNPFDLRWGSGAERESPYHRNKVGFSKSALPLRRKDLPLQVVILRAQECSLSWHYGTLLKPSKSDPGKGGGTTLES